MTPVPMPRRLFGKPKDHRGFVVPFFVQWFKDGQRARAGAAGAVPDFRVIDSSRLVQAVTFGKCWICGDTLGSLHAHVIGPMCAVTRLSSEPGSHRECAEYACQVCPFLVRPAMKRNPTPYVVRVEAAPGEHIASNPGVMALWITKGPASPYRTEIGKPGTLFALGDPAVPVTWWREGRAATRAEVDAAIAHGIEAELMPRAEKKGAAAVDEIGRLAIEVRPFLPAPEGAP